ncbi:hypothetical protein FRB99_003700 [Tulasnella sp. 403]|nr:hypothetical protein FRB99_003700 [Tulasnella sp. 403]
MHLKTHFFFDPRVDRYINVPKAPDVYVVHGSQIASHYAGFRKTVPPTPLWVGKTPGFFPLPKVTEHTVHVKIDNNSVFVPGGNPANGQYGFRRTELITQGDRNAAETGAAHEYQVVMIEAICYGSNFANPTQAHLPTSYAKSPEVTDHPSLRFEECRHPQKGDAEGTLNLTATAGPDGQGDFHFGVLKLLLVNPKDAPANQGDVVHYGIQEGTTDALYYSGVFVESVVRGVSIGYGKTAPAIGK